MTNPMDMDEITKKFLTMKKIWYDFAQDFTKEFHRLRKSKASDNFFPDLHTFMLHWSLSLFNSASAGGRFQTDNYFFQKYCIKWRQVRTNNHTANLAEIYTMMENIEDLKLVPSRKLMSKADYIALKLRTKSKDKTKKLSSEIELLRALLNDSRIMVSHERKSMLSERRSFAVAMSELYQSKSNMEDIINQQDALIKKQKSLLLSERGSGQPVISRVVLSRKGCDCSIQTNEYSYEDDLFTYFDNETVPDYTIPNPEEMTEGSLYELYSRPEHFALEYLLDKRHGGRRLRYKYICEVVNKVSLKLFGKTLLRYQTKYLSLCQLANKSVK